MAPKATATVILPIRTLGDHDVELRLHHDVTATLKIRVVRGRAMMKKLLDPHPVIPPSVLRRSTTVPV